MGHQGQIQDSQRTQDCSPGRYAKETKTGPHGNELGNESQEIAEAEINHGKPSPEGSEAVKDQLRVAALGHSPQAHRHLLYHDGHYECQHDKGKEKADAKASASHGVGDHAGTVSFSQHDQDSWTNQQPQQAQP